MHTETKIAPHAAGTPETMGTADYYADDDNFDGNDEQIDGLKRAVLAYRDAARAVVASWETGDLAAAVRGLQAVLDDATALPPGFWEDKAERIGFSLTQGKDGNHWTLQGDDTPTPYQTAQDAVQSRES